MSDRKDWGIFDKNGVPLATSDEHWKWKCPDQRYISSSFECPYSGELIDQGFVAEDCPWDSSDIKKDVCKRCLAVFIYP